MNTTECKKRNNQEKRDILKVLNSLRDATFKQNQAAVLQTLGMNLSRPSLYRLEKNRDKYIYIYLVNLEPFGFQVHH